MISLDSSRSPKRSRTPSVSSSRSSTTSSPADFGHLTGISIIANHLVVIDSSQTIRLLPIEETDGFPILGPSIVELTAHREGVLGVSVLEEPLASGATFFTWSTDGQILFWDPQGRRVDEIDVEVDQLPTIDKSFNEVRVVRASPAADFFLCGDKFGVLKYVLSRSLAQLGLKVSPGCLMASHETMFTRSKRMGER